MMRLRTPNWSLLGLIIASHLGHTSDDNSDSHDDNNNDSSNHNKNWAYYHTNDSNNDDDNNYHYNDNKCTSSCFISFSFLTCHLTSLQQPTLTSSLSIYSDLFSSNLTAKQYRVEQYSLPN